MRPLRGELVKGLGFYKKPGIGCTITVRTMIMMTITITITVRPLRGELVKGLGLAIVRTKVSKRQL